MSRELINIMNEKAQNFRNAINNIDSDIKAKLSEIELLEQSKVISEISITLLEELRDEFYEQLANAQEEMQNELNEQSTTIQEKKSIAEYTAEYVASLGIREVENMLKNPPKNKFRKTSDRYKYCLKALNEQETYGWSDEDMNEASELYDYDGDEVYL